MGKSCVCNIWLNSLPDSWRTLRIESGFSVANEGPTRLNEITSIMKAVDSLEKIEIPVVIGGDFNFTSLRLGRSAQNFNGKVVQWPVSETMLEYDYTDSFRKAHRRDKLWKEHGAIFPRDIISDRIDFVYYRVKI